MAFSPSDPILLGDLAYLLANCGHPDEAVAQANDAIRLQPNGPPDEPDYYRGALAWGSYLAGRCEDAIGVLEDMERKPLTTLAACYVRLGRLDRARSTMADFVKDNPGWTIKEEQAFPFQIAATLRQRWFEDIRTAGLPEK